MCLLGGGGEGGGGGYDGTTKSTSIFYYRIFFSFVFTLVQFIPKDFLMLDPFTSVFNLRKYTSFVAPNSTFFQAMNRREEK